MTSNLPEKHVVTCFLESDGKILLLRRSQQVGSYQGRWAGVSGYIEVTPDEQALTEIQEETSLQPEDLQLLRRGEILTVDDKELGVRWLVHPYIFHINDRSKIHTDWEHLETRWVSPKDIDGLTTVPRLKDTLYSVYTG
jgi:ADP-ribose pyrophosphatase YjhB (NUDIX family)